MKHGKPSPVEVTQDVTGIPWKTLPVIPLAAGFGAWAAGHWGKASLGAWRYAIVVPLTVYAVYMCAMVLMMGAFGLAMAATKEDAPRWPRVVGRYLTPGLMGGAVVALLTDVVSALAAAGRPSDLVKLYAVAAGFLVGCVAERVLGPRRRRRRRERQRQGFVFEGSPDFRASGTAAAEEEEG